MSLDGLRAWIGEVERKLGVRSRVFLVLAAIAIGAAGAGIYLALDARDSAVTEAELRGVQDELEARLGVAATAEEDPDVTRLEAELQALRDEVDALRGDGATPAPGSAPEGTPGTAPGGASGSREEGRPDPNASTDPTVPGPEAAGGGAARLKELVEEGRDGEK